jgi:hypothetical protein
MNGKRIGVKFNRANQRELWREITYHGAANLRFVYCHETGQQQEVTSEHADRLIGIGYNVYVDIPWAGKAGGNEHE